MSGNKSCREKIVTSYVMFHGFSLNVNPWTMATSVMLLSTLNTGVTVLQRSHYWEIPITMVLLMNTNNDLKLDVYMTPMPTLYSFLLFFAPMNVSGTFQFSSSLWCTQQTNASVQSIYQRCPSAVAALKLFCPMIFSVFCQILLGVHWLLYSTLAIFENVYRIVSLPILQLAASHGLRY